MLKLIVENTFSKALNFLHLFENEYITATETETDIIRKTTIHVAYPVETISFTNDDACVVNNKQLTATVTTRNETLTNKLVSFSSSDESIAIVDENGQVTAIATGSVTITATSDSVSTSINLNVISCPNHAIVPVAIVSPTYDAPGAYAHYRCTLCDTHFRDEDGSEIITEYAIPALNDMNVLFIPDGVTEIEDEAFAGNTSIQAVIVPSNCTRIGLGAFSGCTGLKYIRVPRGISCSDFGVTVAVDEY